MAAVLAVALLLLCGNVHSAEEEALTGYVTQVKTGESNTLSTAPVASPDLAPAISTPTGSDATHSAVLSAVPQNERSDVMLVDLARADDEQMNMTLREAPAPSPPAEAIPDGFDMEEADAPSTDVEAPGPDSPQPDSALPAVEEPSEGTQGTLVSDTNDTNYPNLPDSPDYSTGSGYGVRSETSGDEATSGDDSQAVSFTTSSEESTDESQGTLVSDTNDTNYPNLPDSPDYVTGSGYGVRSETSGDEATSGDDSQAVSFTTSSEESTDESQGTLVSDTNDTNYPNLPDSPDYSTGSGYGVRSETSDDEATSGDDSQAVSFTTSSEESTDESQGTLVSDTNDTNYPNLPDSPDYSTGSGYGVRSETSGDEATSGDDSQAVSFTTSSEESTDESQGTLVSDTNDTNYPNLPDSPDYSTGSGYGVRSETSGDEATSGDDSQAVSFTTSSEESTDESQGTLVSDTNDTNYPNLPDSPDYVTGSGYGVRSATSADEAASDDDSQAVSFTTSSEESTDESQGTLVSDTNDTNYPNLPDSPDYVTGSGYGVRSETSDDEAASGDDSQAVSFTTSSEESTDESQGTLVSDTNDTNYPNLPDSPDYSTGSGYGVGGQDAAVTHDEAESGSDTSAVTLRQSRTYSPPPQPRATWGKGKCTFYGGMDAAGTMSGACGYGNLYASGYGAFTAALSSALFKNGMACGACYEVACSGNPKCKPGSVQVTVTNFCPPNPGQSATNGGWCNGANQHFDLSYPAFAKIADPKAGVVDLNYRRVPCKKNGGVRYTMNGNCNFNLVTITNVGGSGVVTAVYMKGDGMAWAPLSRNWGANWQCSRNYCGKGISIKIVTSDKKVSVSRLAGKDWAFGKTYIGKQVN